MKKEISPLDYRINELIKEAETLPKSTARTTQEMLFDHNYDNELSLYFFISLQKCLKHPGLRVRTDGADLTGDAKTVYKRLNSPGHPVREGLLLMGIDCLADNGETL